MSIPLNVNGVVYDYPEVDDTDWGPEATDWASAVTTGMLQKAAGLFQLLAELDFGTSWGVKSLYYKTRSTSPALTGQFRLGNDEEINWRNAANDADLTLKVNSSNVLEFDGSGISAGGTPVQTAITALDTATINLTLTVDNDLSADIQNLSITNGMISTSAAIAYSKLNLTGSILNADLANMAQATFKGRNAGAGTGAPQDLTVTQATAMLNDMVGDSGSGGTKGLVPAPASGDAAAGKYLKADGTWEVPPGGGGGGDITGPGSSTDNAVVRWDGTGGTQIQNSSVIIDDSNNVSGIANLTATGTTTLNTSLTGVVKASSGVLSASTIVNADISASAAIAYSKLNLSGSILNADVSASAAIAFSKLASLTSGQILVGNGSNVATAVSVTGDISITNAGVTAYAGTVPINRGGTGQTTASAALDALLPSQSGESGKVLKTNGTTASWQPDSGSGSAPTVQRFTSGSGTYNLPVGCTWIRVRMVGGGGGGAGSGTASIGVGGAGGNSTFGTSLLVAGGGNGGPTFNTAGTTGGTSSIGAASGTFGPGGNGGGASASSSGNTAAGGVGGNSIFAGAGLPGYAAAGGAGITNSGGGGAGGGIGGVGGIAGGGGSGGGFVDAIIGSPSSTYSYSVGTGGTGGTAGTTGNAGGAGGSGIIIVEEYY